MVLHEKQRNLQPKSPTMKTTKTKTLTLRRMVGEVRWQSFLDHFAREGRRLAMVACMNGLVMKFAGFLSVYSDVD